jgi:hypothetical protein
MVEVRNTSGAEQSKKALLPEDHKGGGRCSCTR